VHVRNGRAIAGVCLALGLAGGLLAPAAAQAGTYQVAICHDPTTGAPAPLDGLSFPDAGQYVDSGVYNETDGECGPGGYVYATLDGVVSHGPSDFAGWEYVAPPGTQITGLEVYRSFYAGASSYYRSPIDTIDTISTSGVPATIADCSQADGCSAAGTDPSTEFVPANALGFDGLDATIAVEGTAVCGGGLVCAPGGAAVCPEIGSDPCMASNRLYALLVTLEDDSAPIPGAVSGTLVDPGVLAGSAGVTFDATDTGSGLYLAEFVVDGQQVAWASFGQDSRCAGAGSAPPLRFDWNVPCPLAGTATITFDTSTLADGAHQASVIVLDAAGNTSTAWSGTIHTDNAPQGGAPQIYGDAQVGQALVATSGSWSPAATSYSYQWLRCNAAGALCTAIQGATAPNYTVSPADAYRQLAVQVSAADADGSTSATSTPTGAVVDAAGYVSPPQGPTLSGGSTPQIVGQTAQGATLTAQPGNWANGPVTYAYQWQRCDAAGLGCVAIAGATGSTYTLGRADDYVRLRVLVSATGPGGTSQAASEPTRIVADASGATAGGAPSGAGGAPVSGAPSSGGGHVANGTGACHAATLRATVEGRASATVALGRAVTVRGSLRCGRTPIAGAQLALAITPQDRLAPSRAAQIRTGPDGSFVYVLGPGPSRRIALSYRAFADDPAVSASASVKVRVRPSISLTITPVSTSNGHTITFTGTVSGGHEPSGGLTLEIEYREGSRWMIYDTVRARRGDGTFTWRYTFRRTTQPITYWFRVAIPASGVSGYPYVPVASPARSVYVVP